MRVRRPVSHVPSLVFCPVSSTRSIILASLYFQSVTTIKFCNHFLLKTIRIAGGSESLLSLGHGPQDRVTLNPLECALMSKHPVLPGFGRSCLSVTSLESALTKIASVTPLECAVTKKGGGRGDCLSDFRRFNSGFKPCAGTGRGGSSSGSRTRRGTFAGCRAAC